MVEVEVVAVVVVVKIMMLDENAGSWRWSITHFLYVFCHKKSCVMDRWTNGQTKPLVEILQKCLCLMIS